MTSEFVPRKVIGKFMHVTDKPLLKNNKHLIFFLVVGYCPFCAAERWAIVESLKKFGTWNNLKMDKSAESEEKYVNIPTFNFSKATYDSKELEFRGVEIADRYFENLQDLTDYDKELLENYNPDQIIPFLLIDGQFMQIGSGIKPEKLQNMEHEQILREINNEQSSDIGNMIKTEIDNITTLVCKSLNSSYESCKEEKIKTNLKDSGL